MIFVLEDDQKRVQWFIRHWKQVVHTDDPVLAEKWLKENDDVDIIFLDHDLGGAPYTRGKNGDGIDLANTMAAQHIHEDTKIIIHSCNCVGAKNMLDALAETHTNVKCISFPTLIFKMSN